MSDIKKHFVSRFEDGWIVEADFDQLEVRVLAYLSQDPVLIEDILSGRDMHRWRASELFNLPEKAITTEQRRIAKVLSFQLQYGAGAASMAKSLELPESLCQAFIKNFYTRYKVVKETQDNWIRTVKKNRVPTKERSTKGLPIGKSSFKQVSGRELVFWEQDAKQYLIVGRRNVRGGDTYTSSPTSFSPTDIKNYPVQSLATGDLTALGRGRLMRRLLKEGLIWDKVLPIMTVHDSIILDVAGTFVDISSRITKEELEKVPVYFEEVFGVPFNIPLPVEIKVGRNWLQMEKVDG